MAFTFNAGWDSAENHEAGIPNLGTAAEVEAAVSSACAGKTSADGLVAGVLRACGQRSSTVKVIKGIHQAEDAGWVGATYHVTVSLPLGRNSSKTYHVYFGITTIAMAKPKGISQGKWRKMPAAQKSHQTFNLVEVSYIWDGIRQSPTIT